MYRGVSAESDNACRKRVTAAFKPRSKSTTVPSGHRRWISSSRVTTSPELLQECSEHLKRLFLKADAQSLFSEFSPVEVDFENPEPHCSSR